MTFHDIQDIFGWDAFIRFHSIHILKKVLSETCIEILWYLKAYLLFESFAYSFFNTK